MAICKKPHLEPLVVAEAKNNVELVSALLLLRHVAPHLRRHHFPLTGAYLASFSPITGTHFLAASDTAGALVRVSLRLGRAEIRMYSHLMLALIPLDKTDKLSWTHFHGYVLSLYNTDNLYSVKFPTKKRAYI